MSEEKNLNEHPEQQNPYSDYEDYRSNKEQV